MAKLTFIGYSQAANKGLKTTILWGEKFTKGKAREIESPAIVAKAKHLDHFEVTDE